MTLKSYVVFLSVTDPDTELQAKWKPLKFKVQMFIIPQTTQRASIYMKQPGLTVTQRVHMLFNLWRRSTHFGLRGEYQRLDVCWSAGEATMDAP